jgi:RNA polymerase sigma-70 factor (ECF subfamily)
VYNVAYRVLHSREDTEEITQEVFLKVYHNIKYFRMQSSFKTWIYRITVNCAINRLKKIISERDKAHEYFEYVDKIGAGGNQIDDNEGGLDGVDSLLKSLNPDQKVCMVLRGIEALSYQEIADTLGISINTVRTRLKRAREKLLKMKKGVVKNEV